METLTFMVVTSDQCWGKGPDLETALKEARGVGSRATRGGKKVDFIVYEFGDDIDADSLYMDGMGRVLWTKLPEAGENDGEPLKVWGRMSGVDTEKV